MDRLALLDLLGGAEALVQLAPGLKVQGLELSPQEGFVLSRVGAGIRVRELCQITGLGDEETLRILTRLKQAEVILSERPPAPAAPRKEPVRIAGASKAPVNANQGPPIIRPHRAPPPTSLPPPITSGPTPAPSLGTPPAPSPTSQGPLSPAAITKASPAPLVKVQDRQGGYRVVVPRVAQESPAPVRSEEKNLRRPAVRAGTAPPTPASSPGTRSPTTGEQPFRAETPVPRTLEKLAAASFPLEPALLEEEVEIDLETRRLILYLHQRLTELDYYQLLSIRPDVEDKELRRAFLQRTQLLHPDRYFRKKIGSYGPRLHELYKAVSTAYDTLSDPKARKLYDQTLSLSRFAAEGIDTRRYQAGRLYEEGKRLAEAGDFRGAERALLQATELDAKDERYRVLLLRVQASGRQLEASQAKQKALEEIRQGRHLEAIEPLRRALELDEEPELLQLLATCLLRIGKELHEAARLSRRALTLKPDHVDAALTLSYLEEQLGNFFESRAALEPLRHLASHHKRLRERLIDLDSVR